MIAPVTRLRVYAPILTALPEDDYYDGAIVVNRTMYDAFQASLAFRLRLCRVAGEVLSSEPPPVGSAEGPDVAPTGILTIRVVDKEIVKGRFVNRRGQTSTFYKGKLYFGLDLTDLHSHQSVWSARSSFRFPMDNENFGSAFARGIVAQLQRDGVLTSCVREAYPGCMADQHDQRSRAEGITDARERRQQLLYLRKCR